jgi:hypothetical protein
MKLLQGLVLSGAVAFGVASVAMAQGGAQPAGPAGAPGGGGFRGGAPRPVHAPAEGGVFGMITGVSAKGFEVTAPANQKVTIALAPNTKYRKGKAASSARAIKVGQRVRVLGAVEFGTGTATTITAAQVVLQPVEGGGSETSIQVATAVVAVLLPVQNAQGAQGGQGARAGGAGAGAPGGQGPRAAGGPPGAGAPGGQGPRAGGAAPGAGAGAAGQARQGLPVPARHIGQINPDWGDAGDSRTTIAAGSEADRATEVAMATPYSSGGIVDRVVKEPDGAYLVHNIGVSWPHHIFVSADFRPVGAAN